jgi:hypothetical protein
MAEETDWRLSGEEEWMYDAVLRWARFVPRTEDWDHEHCSLCSTKFGPEADPDEAVEAEGYVYGGSDQIVATLDERTTHSPGLRVVVEAPTDERWICSGCFGDFEAHFRWTSATSR